MNDPPADSVVSFLLWNLAMGWRAPVAPGGRAGRVSWYKQVVSIPGGPPPPSVLGGPARARRKPPAFAESSDESPSNARCTAIRLGPVRASDGRGRGARACCVIA